MNIDTLEYRLLKKAVYTSLNNLSGQLASLYTQANADYTTADGNYSVTTMETTPTTNAAIYRTAADSEQKLWDRVKDIVDAAIADIAATKP